ncbi:germination protein M [Virgibacillus subterraneus]|uniref:Germination protein M n=1 Tax=Virgibacillus subterraneus TaxID=621109 RepID=A0A1H9DJ54_9BACI|nr:GerMN domain-containing protein [Virgibacillus subterraneus]SEQ13494.1 germination protein M [Virgibacillus subterraneus]
MQKRSTLLLIITVCLSIILTGCFQGEQSIDNEEMDPPKDAEAVNDLDNVSDEAESEGVDEESDGEAEPKTVGRQLYLIDSDGMVASQTLQLPQIESKEVAIQALQHLVKGGPVTSLLPNGFQAVLPAGTQVNSLSLEENGTLIVDVSEEFKNYEEQNELKVLQAMTYTLTQFESVDNIKLRINGEAQTEMPVSGTPIGEGYSRVNGINLIHSDSVDLMASKPVTLYYPSVHDENQYFVPVTQYINVENQDLYGSVIEALLDGPGVQANVQHVFNNQTELTSNPSLRDGVLELVFSEEVLQDGEKAVISDEVMETLVRTLTEDPSVEAVQVKVENVETLFNENGEPYTTPVTTQTFSKTEKL